MVSTYGDGEPPDNGRRFYRELQALTKAGGANALSDKPRSEVPDNADPGQSLLSSLSFDVLALGDRSYPKFCQFGADLYTTLAQLGARASAPLQTFDKSQLVNAAANTTQSWQLLVRQRLNSQTQPGLYLLRFTSTQPLPHWRAGDLVAISPENNPEVAARRYSVASVPQSNEMQLIIRQHIDEHSQPGLCSGWLTQDLTLDGTVNMQLQPNPSCHINDAQAPLLLIGAGSGLAGIRGHLSERIHLAKQARQTLQQPPGPVWLIYGERSADLNPLLKAELAGWQQAGMLHQLDYAFSQDPANPCYVQDLVQKNAAQIARFIGSSGHIYVCGRYDGMGSAVDAQLQLALGTATYHHLIEQGCYHRDLY
ncbi:NADPH cytochrome P450 oxidoreductase family protein [Arsukibacterium indicum]|uniref:Flavodoxin domain-containing protein n=1 Tax=Arsukibacterium indicum TaxID=2848612 RepID=A0ABS6MIT8_9GAMM|nr:NADPH cytochrome P450 oxidoreductase family protein [Arsukibacterium indicum]MBV2128731.1 flavodoxin domain-containing protein [Arsukibacterium indicum]